MVRRILPSELIVCPINDWALIYVMQSDVVTFESLTGAGEHVMPNATAWQHSFGSCTRLFWEI
jgi:hypothetical protein